MKKKVDEDKISTNLRSTFEKIINSEWNLANLSEPRETSLCLLKDYAIMKQVIWNSTITRDPETKEEVQKEDRVLNVSNLLH